MYLNMSEKYASCWRRCPSYISGSLNPKRVDPSGNEDDAFMKALRTVQEMLVNTGTMVSMSEEVAIYTGF